jgi:hypothetical protein
MIRVGKSIVNIFEFSQGPDEPYERMEMVSLLLIERVEPVTSPSAA